MKSIMETAMALSDGELLAHIATLAVTERETTAELVAHLAALEIRPSLYLAQGYGSLFRYCTGALRLSEDAACSRIKVTRACREFPMILDLMAAGTVSLTTVKMLAPYLTAANHEAVLARAANRAREDIEALVAELAPQPDRAASVRRVPSRKEAGPSSAATALLLAPVASAGMAVGLSGSTMDRGDGAIAESSREPAEHAPSLPDRHHDAGSVRSAQARPNVRASAPNRYRVQFTIDRETYDELRRVQALLRREIPSGDPGVIFGRALRLLRQKVEKAKFAAGGATYEMRIRPRTDDRTGSSRHIPNAVKRAVWRRDGGQCAFLSADGRRCAERAFLELHHLRPYALDGAATVGNIALRCRRHNQYESELIFGPYEASRVRETDERRYGSA